MYCPPRMDGSQHSAGRLHFFLLGLHITCQVTSVSECYCSREIARGNILKQGHRLAFPRAPCQIFVLM